MRIIPLSLLVLLPSIIATHVPDDGKCGGNQSCKVGCCSEWNYCGATAQHCGVGCQPAFGPCGLSQTAAAAQNGPDQGRTTSPLETSKVASLDPPGSQQSDVSVLASGSGGAQYTVYKGDGTTKDGWPAILDWIKSFDLMWSVNGHILNGPCQNPPSNSDQEVRDIQTAILSISNSSGVDARFILAVVIQESKGCVRVATTANSNRNPGLMQSHDGTGNCMNRQPCPQSQIHQMIADGVVGTPSGNGLRQLLGSAGLNASSYYKAAKKYNSGDNIDTSDMAKPAATACYVSDIANRLKGWNGDGSPCIISKWL